MVLRMRRSPSQLVLQFLNEPLRILQIYWFNLPYCSHASTPHHRGLHLDNIFALQPYTSC